MNIEPLNDKVVIKPSDASTTTSSGIVIPDTAEGEKPVQGEVMAVGPGKMQENGQRSSMSVKVGDTVLFTKYAPDEVEVDGQEYLVVDEEKIVGIVTN